MLLLAGCGGHSASTSHSESRPARNEEARTPPSLVQEESLNEETEAPGDDVERMNLVVGDAFVHRRTNFLFRVTDITDAQVLFEGVVRHAFGRLNFRQTTRRALCVDP